MFSFCSGTIFQIEGGRTYVSAISNVDLVISFELQYCESCSRQTANPLSNIKSLAPLFESGYPRRQKSLDWYDLVSRKLFGHVQVIISPP